MSNNLRKITVDTYDNSAQELAEYFKGIGSRVTDIDRAFEFAGNPKNAKVVEIGCGDGRDAKEIIKRTKDYVGFDISKELIKLARKHVPKAKFEVADAVTFDYPKNLNIVFAFASLLHLDKNEVRLVLTKASEALKPGGIFYISLKYADEYGSKVKEDKYGKRLFYFYNPKLIEDLAGNSYTVVKSWQEMRGQTDWFEITLQKQT